MAVRKVATSVTSLSVSRLSGNKTGNTLATEWQHYGQAESGKAESGKAETERFLTRTPKSDQTKPEGGDKLIGHKNAWTAQKGKAGLRGSGGLDGLARPVRTLIYHDQARFTLIGHDWPGFGYGSRSADFLVGGCTGHSNPVLPIPAPPSSARRGGWRR